MDKFNDIQLEFWGVLIIAIMVFSTMILKEFVAKRLNNLSLSNKFKSVRSIYETVYRELAYLRAISRSSRTYVLQFHNGEHFFSNNPRFKITQTYVSAAPGFDTGNKFKDLDASLVKDIIATVFDDVHDSIKGIRKLIVRNEDKSEALKNVYVGVTKDLDTEGLTKAIMQENGVDAFVFTPIISKDNEIIGILILSYCEYDYWTRINEESFAKQSIKDTAKIIGMHISQAKPSFFKRLLG